MMVSLHSVTINSIETAFSRGIIPQIDGVDLKGVNWEVITQIQAVGSRKSNRIDLKLNCNVSFLGYEYLRIKFLNPSLIHDLHQNELDITESYVRLPKLAYIDDGNQ